MKQKIYRNNSRAADETDQFDAVLKRMLAAPPEPHRAAAKPPKLKQKKKLA